MKITMLGTGHAMVTRYFNTCFVIEKEKQYFLVDGGGGNGLLHQLEDAGIPLREIHEIFVTHKHLDHITGIFWVLRFFLQGASRGMPVQEVHIYAHDEVIGILKTMTEQLLDPSACAQIGKAVQLIPVQDGEERTILGKKVTFFDIHAEKAKQYGFCMNYEEGKKLVCLGDEPYADSSEVYVKDAGWCMHEAFCLDSDSSIYHPSRIKHSTVKTACQTAERLRVKNLILYHTEDAHTENRKELYTAEGKQYFHGNLYIPEDLETIEL